MRMIKRAAAFLLAAVVAAALTGCWNNRPITTLALVVGIGLDQADDGNIELTAQIVIPTLLGQAASGSGGGNGGNAGVNVTVEGQTIFDAARNLLTKIDRKAYMGHVQVLVVGEKMARDGIDDSWDFLERDNEFNRTMRVIVVQGGTAKSLLETKPDLGKLSATQIEDNIENGLNLGKGVQIKTFEVTQLLGDPDTAIVTGLAQVGSATNLTDVTIQGAAVFKHAKLVGYLDPETTRGYLFARGQIQSTILVVPNPAEPDKKISLEVIRSSSQIRGGFSGGRPQLTIQVSVGGNLGDEQGTQDLYTSRYISKVESAAAKLVELDIQSALEFSRSFSCDIFSLNSMLYRSSYATYHRVQKQWDTVYPTTDFHVKVQFHLDRPGLIKRPAFRQ